MSTRTYSFPLLRAARRQLRQRKWEWLRPPAAPPGWRAAAPDFVGVGAQKAGTSWWFALLTAHPGVHYSSKLPKELHFFDRYWRVPFTPRHAAEYHRFFPRPPGGMAGEWTPRYMVDFWVPELLRTAAPDAKLLVLLRDPVERYRSGLTHESDTGALNQPVTAVEGFDRGLYHAQLQRLERFFPRDQMLVLQYERCRQDTKAELARTYRFLGLDNCDFVPEGLTRLVNRTRAAKFPLQDSHRRLLVELYSEDVAKLAADYPSIDVDLWPNFNR